MCAHARPYLCSIDMGGGGGGSGLFYQGTSCASGEPSSEAETCKNCFSAQVGDHVYSADKVPGPDYTCQQQQQF